MQISEVFKISYKVQYKFSILASPQLDFEIFQESDDTPDRQNRPKVLEGCHLSRGEVRAQIDPESMEIDDRITRWTLFRGSVRDTICCKTMKIDDTVDGHRNQSKS